MRSALFGVDQLRSLRESLLASFMLAQGALALSSPDAAGSAPARHCGPPASGLPWWTPLAVSGLLLVVALAYVLRHRRKSTPTAAAPLPGEDPVVLSRVAPPAPARVRSWAFPMGPN